MLKPKEALLRPNAFQVNDGSSFIRGQGRVRRESVSVYSNKIRERRRPLPKGHQPKYFPSTNSLPTFSHSLARQLLQCFTMLLS